jgi:hypothetical protein
MPILQQILQRSGVERRAIGRTRINRGALLFFSGKVGVVSCCVRDVTNEGAGIRLDGFSVVPIDFYLSFDKFRTSRTCRLVWRDGDFLGVMLDQPKR